MISWVKMEIEELLYMLERINDFLRKRKKFNLTRQEYQLADALLQYNIDVSRLRWQLQRVNATLRKEVLLL